MSDLVVGRIAFAAPRDCDADERRAAWRLLFQSFRPAPAPRPKPEAAEPMLAALRRGKTITF